MKSFWINIIPIVNISPFFQSNFLQTLDRVLQALDHFSYRAVHPCYDNAGQFL